ncbi:hypothetical protein EVAR_64400_1 [Eumeta japonica]|uniref:Uncharacterized protein n=1 Tax=Eumeta variegata TaxID=151549 RepID=A0A4C1ZXH4_EUMVA|nr:hypothetical protein EVAR_64400_1 [Eumeta japonica]
MTVVTSRSFILSRRPTILTRSLCSHRHASGVYSYTPHTLRILTIRRSTSRDYTANSISHAVAIAPVSLKTPAPNPQSRRNSLRFRLAESANVGTPPPAVAVIWIKQEDNIPAPEKRSRY